MMRPTPTSSGTGRRIPVVPGRVQGRWRPGTYLSGNLNLSTQARAANVGLQRSSFHEHGVPASGRATQGYAAVDGQVAVHGGRSSSLPVSGAVVVPVASCQRYPDSTRMHVRPTLTAVNAASGAHVVSSGLHLNRTGVSGHEYSTCPVSRDQYIYTGAPEAYGSQHAEPGIGQSRLLVGARGYTKTSAWPVRLSSQCPRVPSPAVSLATLGLNTEMLAVVTTRVLTHWDLAGQYTHDGLCSFLHNVCVRMELDVLCLFSALLYTDRLRARFPDAGASSCAKRVLTMGLLTAAKYQKDHPFDNRSWARLCDILLSTLNAMERQFLEALSFELFLAPQHVTELVDSIEREQGVSLHDQAQFVLAALTPQPSRPSSPTAVPRPSEGVPLPLEQELPAAERPPGRRVSVANRGACSPQQPGRRSSWVPGRHVAATAPAAEKAVHTAVSSPGTATMQSGPLVTSAPPNSCPGTGMLKSRVDVADASGRALPATAGDALAVQLAHLVVGLTSRRDCFQLSPNSSKNTFDIVKFGMLGAGAGATALAPTVSQMRPVLFDR